MDVGIVRMNILVSENASYLNQQKIIRCTNTYAH